MAEMNRRSLLSVGAVTPLLGWPKLREDIHYNFWLPHSKTLSEFMDAVDRLPDQRDGLPCWHCQTGEPYEEFYSKIPYRLGDEDAALEMTIEDMARHLNVYLNETRGTIFWRIRLKFADDSWSRVLWYDENGPDYDFLNDKRCFMDKAWRVAKMYCRLIRTDRPIIHG